MKRNSTVLHESDLSTECGLSAMTVHERLLKLAKAHRRLESALCFYLLEVEKRALFRHYGHASTVDYAREELGLEDGKTRTLMRLAIRLEELPKMKAAFGRGEIPYTKAREAVKAATPETEETWIRKCKELSNRQLEREVKKEVPAEPTRFVSFLLDEGRIAVWERVREAMERMAGKTLTELEVWDLMCAVAMLEHDLTPPLGDESAPMTGYVREVIERDGFRCTRPGCGNRSALQGSHIRSRARGGRDDPSNLHTACAACHQAIERGILKVRGTAPDDITWEGPFGIIETPQRKTRDRRARADRVSEARASYGRESGDGCTELDAYHVAHAEGAAGELSASHVGRASRKTRTLPRGNLAARKSFPMKETDSSIGIHPTASAQATRRAWTTVSASLAWSKTAVGK
jgi:hypothetical protein